MYQNLLLNIYVLLLFIYLFMFSLFYICIAICQKYIFCQNIVMIDTRAMIKAWRHVTRSTSLLLNNDHWM